MRDPIAAPRTVEFRIRAGWRTGAVDAITWNFGDATSGTFTGTLVGSGTDSSGGSYVVYEYVFTHTYASNGPFTALWSSNARISNLQNGANGPWRTFTVVDLRGGNTAPPISSAPALVQMPISATASTTFSANDPDGDAIACRFATPAEVGLPAGSEPRIGGIAPTIATTASGCEVSWNTSGSVNGRLYSLWVVVEST